MNRKELIRAYKETARPMGVFRVHNTVADRSFVGRSLDVPSMLNRMRAQLSFGGHPCKELQRDWNALGAEAFAFEVLDTLPARDEPGYDPADDLAVLEALWLERLQPYGERGYMARR